MPAGWFLFSPPLKASRSLDSAVNPRAGQLLRGRGQACGQGGPGPVEALSCLCPHCQHCILAGKGLEVPSWSAPQHPTTLPTAPPSSLGCKDQVYSQDPGEGPQHCPLFPPVHMGARRELSGQQQEWLGVFPPPPCVGCGEWGTASRPRPPGPRPNFPSEKVLLTIKYLSQQGRPWLPWPTTSKKRKIKGNPEPEAGNRKTGSLETCSSQDNSFP